MDEKQALWDKELEDVKQWISTFIPVQTKIIEKLMK